MNKKILTIIITIIIVFAIALGILYIIDMNNIKNNKPIIFSNWGKTYTPPEHLYNIENIEIENLPKQYSLEQAIKDGCFVINNNKT